MDVVKRHVHVTGISFSGSGYNETYIHASKSLLSPSGAPSKSGTSFGVELGHYGCNCNSQTTVPERRMSHRQEMEGK